MSAEVHSRFVEELPLGVYHSNQNGQIIYSNKAFAQLLGFEDTTLLQKHRAASFYVDEADRETWLRLLESQGVLHDYEMQWRRLDGVALWVKETAFVVRRPDGSVDHYEGVVQNVTSEHDLHELKQSPRLDALQENDKLYLLILDSLPVFALRKDLEGRFTFGNRLFYEKEVGSLRRSIIGLRDSDLYPGMIAAKYQRDDAAVMKSGKVFETTEQHTTGEGGYRFVHVVKAPVRNHDGKIVGVQCLYWDAAQRDEAMAALHQSIGEAALYRSVIENAFGIAWQQDMLGAILSINAEGRSITGFSEEDVQRLHVDDLVAPEDRERIKEEIRKLTTGDLFQVTIPPIEFQILTKRAERIPVEATFRPVFEAGKAKLLQCYGRDLRERRRQEAERIAEIHHRVKNNLQMVLSLLRLESDKLFGPQWTKQIENLRAQPQQHQSAALAERIAGQFKAGLEACQHRVHSMGLIHEMLYKTTSTTRIRLAQYMRGLCAFLAETAGGVPVHLNIDESVEVGLDTAVPCGLIINELFSNAVKHGFDKRKGEIRISVFSLSPQDKLFQLVFADNGCGLPRDFNPREASGLGLRLVFGLAESELQGEVHLSRAHGTTFTIQFRDITKTKV